MSNRERKYKKELKRIKKWLETKESKEILEKEFYNKDSIIEDMKKSLEIDTKILNQPMTI